MLSRTHLAFSLFIGLILINSVQNPFWFFGSLIFATFLPDLDSYTSKFGKRFFSRVLTAFTKHRGIMHSVLFMLGIYILLYFYFPFVSFGFLVGYMSHLVGDSITKQGVRLFYPFKFRIKGFLKTGGKFESFLFLLFGLLDFVLFFNLVFKSIF